MSAHRPAQLPHTWPFGGNELRNCAQEEVDRRNHDPRSNSPPWAGAPVGVVFHDLVNPCLTTSLTLSHVKERGYRGGSVGGSFLCGRSAAIQDFTGMGGQTHGPLANWRAGGLDAVEK